MRELRGDVRLQLRQFLTTEAQRTQRLLKVTELRSNFLAFLTTFSDFTRRPRMDQEW